MQLHYREWLAERYAPATVNAQLHRTGRIESHYGNLDTAFNNDRLESLIAELSYSAEDQRKNRPNPTKLPIDGNIQNNIASYRDAIRRYKRFLEEQSTAVLPQPAATETQIDNLPSPKRGETFSLERDLQSSLRASITQLELGLVIIDDGAERSVETGFIDILARDAHGRNVVIELKIGTAPSSALTQILGYMADIKTDMSDSEVRGILIAEKFDKRTIAAASLIPNLDLIRYGFNFTFSAA